jgi:hypothetical protein
MWLGPSGGGEGEWRGKIERTTVGTTGYNGQWGLPNKPPTACTEPDINNRAFMQLRWAPRIAVLAAHKSKFPKGQVSALTPAAHALPGYANRVPSHSCTYSRCFMPFMYAYRVFGPPLPGPSPIARRPSPVARRPSPIVHRPSPIAHRPLSPSLSLSFFCSLYADVLAKSFVPERELRGINKRSDIHKE